MPSRTSLPIAALAGLIVMSATARSRAEKPDTRVAKLGEPSNGLRAVLSANRTAFSPGEILELSGYLWNVGSRRVVLPYEPHQWPAGELHIRTPKGEVYVYAPKTRVLPKNNFYAIPPGRVDRLRDMRLRLNDSNGGWVAGETDAPGALRLRDEGTYRIWFEYDIPPIPKAGEDGWSGKAISNTLAISVRSIPAEKRRAKPTPEQLQDLDRMISAKPGLTNAEQTRRGRPYLRLREAMRRTENEGLALEITKRVLAWRDEGTAKWFRNCVAMLSQRAGDGLSAEGPGIDGPYLKMLADGIVRKLNAASKARRVDVPRGRRRGPTMAQFFPAAMAYARLNPKDKEFRDRLVDMFRRSARISDLPRFQGGKRAGKGEKRTYPPVGLRIAWRGLLLLGVLRDGMPVEDAIKVLGEPTRRSDKHIRWYYSTPRHVNPVIYGQIRDGKVTSFQIGRA